MTILTLKQLDRAHVQVRSELRRLGFWSSRLEAVDVLLKAAAWDCYGWQNYGSDGAICIPAVSVVRLIDHLWQGRTQVPLRQVLRHEWAHALAHHHHGLVANREFIRVFDGSHDCRRRVRSYSPERHISEYASQEPMEDFAEVFMEFVKHRGMLPGRWRTTAIERRWQFVAKLPERLRQ